MNIVAVVIVGVGLWSVIGGAQQAPCYFIFGDSMADSGNNNNLWSYAKANYLPYGIDYPLGPTGRFSNGKTLVDVVGQFLNLSSFSNNFFFYILYSNNSIFLENITFSFQIWVFLMKNKLFIK